MERLELTIQYDPDDPSRVAEIASELSAALPSPKWKALLALSRAVCEENGDSVLPSVIERV